MSVTRIICFQMQWLQVRSTRSVSTQTDELTVSALPDKFVPDVAKCLKDKLLDSTRIARIADSSNSMTERRSLASTPSAPAEHASVRCPKPGESHPYLWDSKGNWPIGEPPLEVNEKNTQVLKLITGGNSHNVECIEHNHRPYFLASHVCRMLGADLRPDGLPKSPQIRKKLLEPYDLGAIRVIR